MKENFMDKEVDEVRKEGGVVIEEEVKKGLGRKGGNMWGKKKEGIVKDIVKIGKKMGNGNKVGEVVEGEDKMNELRKDLRYLKNFGGNKV